MQVANGTSGKEPTGSTSSPHGTAGQSGPGQWEEVNEGMGDAPRAYQERVTGHTSRVGYIVNGIKFDSFRNGELVDAKGNYGQFIDPTTGQWKTWFQGGSMWVTKARMQNIAAKGTPIRWVFQQREVADLVKQEVDGKGLNVIVEYKP